MSNVFSVVEHYNGYEVRHNPTNKTHWMGDGVDSLSDVEGNTLSPGTEGFIEFWETVLNADHNTTMEAYFPDVLKEELWEETRMELIGEIIHQLKKAENQEAGLSSDLNHLYAEFYDTEQKLIWDAEDEDLDAPPTAAEALDSLWNKVYWFPDYDLTDAVKVKLVTR